MNSIDFRMNASKTLYELHGRDWVLYRGKLYDLMSDLETWLYDERLLVQIYE